MDIRALRKEMNHFFSRAEALQKAVSRFGGKSEMKIDKGKKKEVKKESQPHTAK